jgi:hypothetical protein
VELDSKDTSGNREELMAASFNVASHFYVSGLGGDV